MFLRYSITLLLGAILAANCFNFNTQKLASGVTQTSFFEQGIVFQDKVWFIGSNQACSHGSYGCPKYLYKSDLTPSGTVAVQALGSNYSSYSYVNFYVLSSTNFAFILEDVPYSLWGVHTSGSSQTVELIYRDSANQGLSVVQFGSRLAFLSSVNFTSSGQGYATIKVTDGTLAGTKNVISYNFNVPYDFYVASCAPQIDTAIGNNHFLYYIPYCNQTDENYKDFKYYISDGTLAGTKYVFNNPSFSLQGLPFSANGIDYLITDVYTIQAEYLQLYGANGLISNINLPDTLRYFSNFIQVGNDVFFIGSTFSGYSNIYKLSSPFTTAQRWVQGDSHNFDKLILRPNGDFWTVDTLSSNSSGIKKPAIDKVSTVQANTISTVYTLPFGTFDCTDYGCAHYQVLSEGLSIYRAQDISHQAYQARLDFLSFSGLDSTLFDFAYGPYGNGISSITEDPLDYHGVLFYTVEYGHLPGEGDVEPSYPYISVPCGDAKVQYPEVCDDGNTNNGDSCSSTCLTTTSSATSSGSSTSSSGSTSTSTTGSISSCTTGYMRCINSETYQTCAHSTWGPAQSCAQGTVCQASGNSIYCVRPSPSPCTSGNMRCVTSETYQTCAHGVWGASQSCSQGLTCHPSGNNIYCY